jgi:hypothetical protein
MNTFIFNLQSLINEINNKPIWLRYVTIRKVIYDKYPMLSHKSNRELTDRLLNTTKHFHDYKFLTGIEYLLAEYLERV